MLKSIEGFPAYKVSPQGEVFSFKWGRKRKLKVNVTSKGYHRVKFIKDGKCKDHYVHRLVSKAFISNPEGKEQVNHKDLNKSNNDASNLEWVTNLENTLHYHSNK